MSELGMRLKNARDEMNISLEELQNITKIQKRYLQAIEQGNLDILPGHFYARAFIKSYAEAVGIDSVALFEEYESELPSTNEQTVEIPARVQTRKIRGTKKTRRFLALLPTIVVVVFIFSILIGIWYYFQGASAVDNQPSEDQVQTPAVEGGRDENALNPEQEVEEETETETEVEEEIVSEEVKQRLELVETIDNETIYNLINAEEFTIKIELLGKSYIGIDNRKGKTFHAVTEEGGKSLAFDFSEEETIQFNFGASNNVDLFINDQPFEFPLDVVHQKVTIHFVEAENDQ